MTQEMIILIFILSITAAHENVIETPVREKRQSAQYCPGNVAPVQYCHRISGYQCPQYPHRTFCYASGNDGLCCTYGTYSVLKAQSESLRHQPSPPVRTNPKPYVYPLAQQRPKIRTSNDRTGARASLPTPFGNTWVGYVKQQIASFPVLIYGKSTCPYCFRAKALLQSYGISYASYDYDKIVNGPQIITAVKRITKRDTVPQIFVCGWFVGGSDQLSWSMRNGMFNTLYARCAQDYPERRRALVG